MGFPLRVAELDLVDAAGLHLRHHFSNGRVAILRQAVDTTAHQEPGSKFLSQAVELVDVAFPITNMHAALGCARQLCRQAQIIKPAHAFLLLDRHPRWIDLAFKGTGSFELAARPEFRRRQSKGQTLRRDTRA